MLARRLAVCIACLSVAAWCAWQLLGRPTLGTDDAEIAIGYAQRLAAGDGLRYRPGGERVEGFSSPLAVGVAALAFASRIPAAGLLVVASVLALALALAWAWSLVRGEHQRPSAWACWIPVAALAHPGFVTWGVLSLLETGLFCALLLAATAAVTAPRLPRTLPALLSLLVLARPEGPAWALGLAAVAWARGGGRPRWRSPLVAATSVAVLLIARWCYFGELLPNTYYAKVAPRALDNLRAGALYLWGFVLERPGWTLAVSTASAIAAWRRTAAGIPLLCTLGGLLLTVWLGGDYFAGHRFIQPLVPLGLLGVALSIARASGRVRALLIALAIAAVAWDALAWRSAWAPALSLEFEVARRSRTAGEALERVTRAFPTPPLVGATAAGGIARTYHGPVLDLMGLNHRRMAHRNRERTGVRNHAAFDPVVFYEESPALMLPSVSSQPIQIYQLGWENEILKGLLREERFTASYALAAVRLDASHFLSVYVRRDAWPALRACGLEVVKLDAKAWGW